MKVFITGASSGLGASLAREYARRFTDCQLGLVARREPRLRELAASLAPVPCQLYDVDVSDAEALRQAARAFVRDVGCPDVVIGNAGISRNTATGLVGDAAIFKRLVDVNVVALFNTFDAFVPAMREINAGTLVGIASVAGVRGLPGAGAYCASKAAVIGYLESLRLEMHKSPIAVVTIVPGFVRTEMTAVNTFPMPFLMDADAFARRTVTAISAGRSLTYIPWQMGWLARLLRLIPNAVFDRVFARIPQKPRAVDQS